MLLDDDDDIFHARPSAQNAEKVTFEGLVTGIHHEELTDYDGFVWSGAGVVGKNWAEKNGYGSDTGWSNVAHGHAVGYSIDDHGTTDMSFAAADGTFTLRSGFFASAWMHEGESVTFTAFRDGTAVGSETFVLTTDPTNIHFGKDFHHIDAVEITAASGTDSDSNVVMDNLKVVFDRAVQHHDWVG